MWPFILVLLMVLIVFGILGFLFLIPIIEAAANGIILYLLFLRVRTELKKIKPDAYAIGLLAAVLLLLLFGNFLPLWWITSAALIGYILTQAYLALEKH